MKKFVIILSFILLSLSVQNAHAQNENLLQKRSTAPAFLKMHADNGFQMPIDCKIGETCWIMNYVDYSPNDGENTDMACQTRTYDGHKGTDFAILDNQAMQSGVDVLAAKEGTITKIRDGEPDLWATPEQLEAIKTQRKECGNAVLIDHGNNLQTFYCHLRNGSISLKPNQRVKAGDKIAQVGLSGLTEFPHVHFMIMKNRKVIDPFTGKTNKDRCGSVKKSLWNKNINVQYQQFDIQEIGYSTNIPTLEALNQNANTPIKFSGHQLIFWTTLLGVKKDDQIIIDVKDPNGNDYLNQKIVQDKNRIRQLYYVGKNLDNHSLTEGAYTVKITLNRPNGDFRKSKFKALLITK